ncbi:MAG: ArsC/Spx/MgsR family protein [Candidatus Neomarinimicrobiota bacterium]
MVALLDERKVKYRKIEYLKTGFTKEVVLALSKKLNKKPIDFVRKNDIDFKNNLQNMNARSDEAVIKLIIEYPKIIERPIVEKGDVAIIGRPVDNVLKLLN